MVDKSQGLSSVLFIFCSYCLTYWLDGFLTFLWPHWFPSRGDVQIFYRIWIFKHFPSRSSSVQINAPHPLDQQTIHMQWFQIKIHQAQYFVTSNHHNLDASCDVCNCTFQTILPFCFIKYTCSVNNPLN